MLEMETGKEEPGSCPALPTLASCNTQNSPVHRLLKRTPQTEPAPLSASRNHRDVGPFPEFLSHIYKCLGKDDSEAILAAWHACGQLTCIGFSIIKYSCLCNIPPPPPNFR